MFVTKYLIIKLIIYWSLPLKMSLQNCCNDFEGILIIFGFRIKQYYFVYNFLLLFACFVEFLRINN